MACVAALFASSALLPFPSTASSVASASSCGCRVRSTVVARAPRHQRAHRGLRRLDEVEGVSKKRRGIGGGGGSGGSQASSSRRDRGLAVDFKEPQLEFEVYLQFQLEWRCQVDAWRHICFILGSLHFIAASMLMAYNIITKSFKLCLMLTILLYQVADFDDLEEDKFLNAVVKVYCTHIAPDYGLPWQKQRQHSSSGSAFMIGDGKLLTNAHCVEHDTQVKVKRRGDDKKYIAKVLARGTECDLALLSVENEEFWKGSEPLQFGRLPCLQGIVVDQPLMSKESALGWHFRYFYSVYRSDEAENIGYVIPTTVVSHFLNDYKKNGKYTGKVFPFVLRISKLKP
ncbi:hypothetical protein PR202_gb24889 [Eleusine coracana subsp. coracana]|uniref:Peptidase S1 domain-containing protein n=1 Tax=Eleusine coracana subsp. coracana TaxID=191504 RepID=A0AAV5FMD8_ELECO|nr:hypothetical protein PR202_gb24889 [Eleusine coracana subsp. coracana]